MWALTFWRCLEKVPLNKSLVSTNRNSHYRIVLKEHPKQSTKLCIEYSITDAQRGRNEKKVYGAKSFTCQTA